MRSLPLLCASLPPVQVNSTRRPSSTMFFAHRSLHPEKRVDTYAQVRVLLLPPVRFIA